MTDTEVPKGLRLYPDLLPGTSTEYTRMVRRARENLSSCCDECGETSLRLQVGLRAEVPRERLYVDVERGRRYSVDVGDYRTLCVRCHRRAQGVAAMQPFCRHGHRYTRSNTRIDRDGSRRCRRCIRDQNRAAAERYRLKRLAEDPPTPVVPRPKGPPPLERKLQAWIGRYNRNAGLGLDEAVIKDLAHLIHTALPKRVTSTPSKPRTRTTRTTA